MLTFERQLLGQTEATDIEETVTQVAGLNAQTSRGPAVGLWTRLRHFDQSELDRLLGGYRLVRANLMRATVHLVTREQYLGWRLALQPTLQRAVRQYCRGIWDDTDEGEVLAAGRQLLHDHDGLTRAEIGRALHPMFPQVSDIGHLGFAIRMLLPVVEKAQPSSWRARAPRYLLAEDAFPGSLGSAEDGRKSMVRAYLRAFGPATAADATYWSGITGLGADLADLGPEGINGNASLFDQPASLTPPRPTFVLPEFDNLFFCRKTSGSPLYEAKKNPVFQPARMPGGLIDQERVVAHWQHAGPSRPLALNEWQPLSRRAKDEWTRFRSWYEEVDQAERQR